jgi:hypothetical protein
LIGSEPALKRKNNRSSQAVLDLKSFASVQVCASDFLPYCYQKLNILVTNAGVMAIPESKTADGFEI